MASTSHDWRAEIVKIFQRVSTRPVWFAEKYNHGFIVRVLSKVSIRFRQLATNYSLWKGVVVIDPCCPTCFNTSEWEYVVQECLNNGTRRFVVDPEWYIKWAHTDPTTRFPKLKLHRENESDSDAEWEGKITECSVVTGHGSAWW